MSLNPGALGSTGPPAQVIDSTADMMAWRFISDGSPIIAVEILGYAQGSPDSVDILLCSSTGGDPDEGTDVGGGSPTLINVTAATWGGTNAPQVVTFTNSYTPTAGDVVWCVMKPNGSTYNGGNRWLVYPRLTAAHNAHNLYGSWHSTDTGTSWTSQAGTGVIQWHTTSSVVIEAPTVMLTSSASTQIEYDTGDTFDEEGHVIIPTTGMDWSLYGFLAFIRGDTAGSDFNWVIYTGTSTSSFTKKKTISVDASVDLPPEMQNEGFAYVHWLLDTPITASDGEQIRITKRATTANAVRLLRIDMGTTARRAGSMFYNNPTMYRCSRDNDTGNFTDDASMVYLTLFPLMNPVAAGGGSPSGVRNPLRGPIG